MGKENLSYSEEYKMRERLWANRKTVLLVSFTILVLLSVYAMLKLTRAERLASYLYSIPYNSVKLEMDNPRTHGGLYPDTLKWSRGGESMFGLQALIACNKTELEYLPTELVGVRAGIRNVSDSTIQLGFAYYSPNKHGIPPNYTLSIEGPHNYPRVFGYLGDDAIYIGPRKKLENMVSIPPSKVFNPSFDSLFYNSSDGLFSFEVPGTYRLWFTYSFDSLTSSLLVPLTLISSDTIELQVIAPEFIESKKLAKFLPREIDGFKSGKPEVHNRLLNPHWTESLQYPTAWRHYFRKMDDFDAPHIGIFIIDSGFLPGVLSRCLSLCKLPETSMTLIKGFQACKLYRPANERKRSYVAISVMVAQRFIIQVEGFGVSIEEAETAAMAIDYAALAEHLR